MKPAITWMHWLTLRSSTLIAMGVDPSFRLEKIGHERPLSGTWARTVGLWRLYPKHAILELAGTETKALEQFAWRWHLRYDRPKLTRTRVCEIAWAQVELHLQAGSPRSVALIDAARETGILPVEAALYHHVLAAFCKKLGCKTEADYRRRMPENAEERHEFWNENNAFAYIDVVLGRSPAF